MQMLRKVKALSNANLGTLAALFMMSCNNACSNAGPFLSCARPNAKVIQISSHGTLGLRLLMRDMA